MSTVHRLTIPMVFPAGVAPGESRDSNRLSIARDGRDQPVLRGTALAGVLRHAYARSVGKPSSAPEVARWFGFALEGEQGGTGSLLRVPDCVLDFGKSSVTQRAHNAVNRHTGAVMSGSLLSLDALPPGTRTIAVLTLQVAAAEDDEPAFEFLKVLLGLIEQGLTLGGNASRGIGLVSLDGGANHRRFDLSRIEEHAAYLDEVYAWRNKGTAPATGDVLQPAPTEGQTLTVDLALKVPRGQDLLVGGGLDLDCDIEPQSVVQADGQRCWRLPGSSLRGAFRAWYARLAAQDGERVADGLDALEAAGRECESLDGDDVAWGLASESRRRELQTALKREPSRLDELISCPVLRLFGSAYARGRIHFSDAYAPQAGAHGGGQDRQHVAVDRITGGANDGALFSSKVLAGVAFAVRVTIQEPTPEEAKRLAKTIRALDLGILRVGSSKAGGRLALAEPVKAEGPESDRLTSLHPSEVDHV